MLRRLLGTAARFLIACYYRRFELGDPLPDTGPTIVVANHPNGLVDPVLMFSRTRRPLHFLAKAPLFDMPVLGAVIRSFGALPVWRAQDGADTALNERTFDAVFDALEAGGAICLFPEGRSHSEPGLQRLKTGAARMALGAEARRGFELGVRIVPVGIVYHQKPRFRSKVATWVGRPIALGDLAPLYAEDERAAVAQAMERIARGLSEVTLDLGKWDDWPRVQLVERIWSGGGGRRVERLQRIARAAERLRLEQPERLHALEERLGDFQRLLERLDIAPERMEPRYSRATLLRFTVENVLGLGLGWPLALAGWALWFVPFALVRIVHACLRPEEDQVATVKILSAAVFYPLWYALVCAWAAYALGPLAATGVALGMPLAGSVAVWSLRRGASVLSDASVTARLARSRSLRERLVERRSELEAELESLARELESVSTSD